MRNLKLIAYSLRNLRLRLNTRSANLYPNAIYARPLQIRVLSISVHGIIMAAQKLALVCHHRFFAALRAFRCHENIIMICTL